MAIFIFQDSPDVFKEFFKVGFYEGVFPVFGAEHNLI
jgi:hypothetical protein